MKRKLAFLFLFVVLGAIGSLGYSIYDRLQEKKAIEKRIASLPEFSVASLNGEISQTTNAAREAPLILTYFNTGCDFCKAEIRSIKQHRGLQGQSIVYLISDEPSNVLKQFAEEFKLDSLQSIQILQDSTQEVKKLFGITGVPSTFVYGEDGILLKNFKGETKAEVIYRLLKETTD